ncbi:MAG TPA: ATP-binding protein [Cellvibrionaceae bacterium]
MTFGNKLWILAIAFVVLFFVISISLSYRSIGIMTENNRQVTNSLQLLNLIKDLRVSVIRAENSLKGYILTDGESHLVPFEQSVYKINEILQSLMTATTTLEQQKIRFEKIHSLVNEQSAQMRAVMEAVDSDNEGIVAAMKADDPLDNSESTLPGLIESMEADEMLLMFSHRQQAESNRKFILISLVATNTIGLFLSLLIFILVYRNTRKVKNLYDEIEKSNAELEFKVSERTHALEIYAEELQRSNRELEDFAFVASHDLQEPLRKIRAFGDRLLQKYSDSLGDRGADYVARMHGASERMSSLINDLLSFSRVTTKQKPFDQVDLNEVFNSAKDDLEYAIESSGASVTSDKLPVIDADATQIRQVFMNLISNSLKFKSEHKAPEISVTCRQETVTEGDDEKEYCYLAFQDNGIGFEQQYADRVFNLFQRLHGREEYEGTGIGLALCRKIIERHGGSISVKSAPGQGALFILELPMTQSMFVMAEDFPIEEME